jgi:sulfoxide reductase catalytic subunit YedY
MKHMSRRQFTRLLIGGMATSLLSNCSPETLPAPATAIPAPTRAQTPTATPSQPLLRNANTPGFYVRYYRPFEAVEPDRWNLAVDGLVRQPQRLSLPEVLALPRRSQVSRMKCVECWSAAARWEGFHLSSLLELAVPQADARWVHFQCADGYYESMRVEELLEERVVLVHHMNDTLLPAVYGAPLRLMVPFLYGYKSAKAIVRIEFAEEERRGYWPTAGGYSASGVIRPGRDHPLDLPGSRQIAGGEEILYQDGIEAGDGE